MNNSKYYHDEIDYYSPAAERRRKRAIDNVNRTYNSKPVISDGLKRLILYAVVTAVSSKVLYEVVKWMVR